jgi:ABC-type nickel/cobalt efflux system permease component RcnA
VVHCAAHPVPSFSYDRTIRVTLTSEGISVDYQLNVDEITIFRDVTRLLDDDERSKLRGALDTHEAYAKAIAPIIADRLEAWQNDKPLTFVCKKSHEPKVEDHVLCRFEFFAKWPLRLEGPQQFRLTETNFEDEKGQVDLGFAPEQGGSLSDTREPDAALKRRPSVERTAEDDKRLHSVSARFEPGDQPAVPQPTLAQEPPQPRPSLWADMRKRGLVAITDSNLGLGLLAVASMIWGAIHALQPGHGKTLVAAYLVGERGTVGHATLLGFITTMSHTGAVLLLSLAILLIPGLRVDRVQAALEFAGGMLIAGMGVWLLLRRLAGQADHVHLFGGHHHHDHGDHAHEHHHHHLPPPREGGVRFWDLLILGISGGIVPCSDAVVLLMAIYAKGKYWLGPPLVLAFSVGLAATLVAVGVAVVKLKGFGASRWGNGRIIRLLPIISAVVIIFLGAWLCIEALPK